MNTESLIFLELPSTSIDDFEDMFNFPESCLGQNYWMLHTNQGLKLNIYIKNWASENKRGTIKEPLASIYTSQTIWRSDN